MAAASLNITLVEPRMLKLNEAATYVGTPVKIFKTICPVQPMQIHGDKLLWDKHDLDRWIDDKKKVGEALSHAEILEKLK